MSTQSALGPSTYVDGTDPEWEKIKKVVLECNPFKEGCATIVCVSCFRFLAFPSQATRIQCGACNGVMSGVQAKCLSCGNSMKIPLGTSEVQCGKCLYIFKPMAKMRVQVPEVVANRVPPPIVLNIKLAESVGFASATEFAARVILSRPLSANIAGWELQSGARFHKVKFLKGEDESGPQLDTARTPVELGLKHNDKIFVTAAARGGRGGDDTGKGAGTSSSSNHDFQVSTFTSPTNCSICREFIWGVLNQGRKCVRCHLPVHHRCAEECSTMCDAARRQMFGIMNFSNNAGGDSDTSSDDDEDKKKQQPAVLAVPIEDPVAFLAACKEDVPPECDPAAVSKLSQLAQFTDDQIGELWTKYDADKSGVLERSEAVKFLCDVVTSFGQPLDPKKAENAELIERLLRRMDTNEDGVVNWEEFYMFFVAQRDVQFLQQFAGTKEFTTEQLYEIWGKYDADGSGELDPDEVFDLLSALTATDPKSVVHPKTKKHKLASFLKPGQKVTWDLFYETFVPLIQNAVKNAKPAAAE